MAYTINKTDGTVLATITDGTSDTSTSLTLFGKSFSGFGELLNENLVKLLESHNSTSAPTAPLKGQVWFDANTDQLKVYDGSAFEPTGGAKSQSAEPSSASAGDLWHDSDDDQLYVYTGSAFQLIGPVYTSGQTLSGWKIETLASSGGNKVVSSMYAGNSRVAILSKETFTPTATQTGFSSIKAGITLNSTLGAVFEGTNTSATFVDVSGTSNSSSTLIAGGNFLRADAADTTTGGLTIDNDAGLTVGDSGELTVTVSSNDVTIAQTSQDKDLKFTVNDNGTTNTILTLDGSETAVNIVGTVNITGNLNVSGEYDATSTTINTYDDAFLKVNTGNSETDAGLIVETSDSDDARLFYDVSENFWTAGDGGSYSQIIRAADTTDDGAANHSTTLKSSSAGGLTLDSFTLAAVGSITEGDTGNKNLASIGAIVAFGDLWGGSAKTVSTSNPSSSDGDNGDFWFVRES
jgi:hypothetical protein|tara:strand:- start:160 stop:1551 length:1392 start_codon:yes stop_codon:yes gene_type:complete